MSSVRKPSNVIISLRESPFYDAVLFQPECLRRGD
jgi:hypothetical protein